MLALSSSVDNAQQPDGVRALRQTLHYLRGRLRELDRILEARVGLEREKERVRQALFALHQLQSANAGKSQPGKTPEKSANG